jgi:hypothetical protein
MQSGRIALLPISELHKESALTTERLAPNLITVDGRKGWLK